MIRNTSWICLVIVAACMVVTAFAELVIIPKDVESIVGGTAQFNCSTTDPSKEIQWFHHKPGSPGKDIVYGYGNVLGTYDGRFSVKKNVVTREYNLEIIAIRAQDIGAYECQDDAGNGNKSQAQLIVLDSNPTCQSDVSVAKVLGKNMCGIQPDIIQLSCTATFQGSTAPALQWIKAGDGTPIRRGITPTTSANCFTYNLTLSGDEVVDGSSYICQTTRSSSGNQYSCASEAIQILSLQSNFSVVEHKSGASVRCPVVVENSCSYKWIRNDEKGDAVVSTEIQVKLDAPGLYRCEADCRIKAKPCTVNAMLVHVVDETSTPVPQGGQSTSDGPFKAAFIVVLILLVIFIILFFVFLLRWRKGRSRALTLEMQPLKPEITSIPDIPTSIIYSPNPTRAQTIKTQSAEANDRSIKGTAILNNELFIISQLESEVEVYDCTTLAFRRKWQLNDLMDPDDATSCVRNRCIYISDNKAEGKEIFRIDMDGNIISRWSIGDESGRLSVTNEATVILSLHDSSKLVEYSPDGLKIRDVQLSIGLTHPMHAVRLANGNFVMTQGYLEDTKHRVCEVNPDGKYVRSFGDDKGSGSTNLTNPTYLAVDREGSIMVADAGNGRVLLIGSNFQVKREIVGKKNGLFIPTRICLDEINGRLYVAEYKRDMRSLLVFNVK